MRRLFTLLAALGALACAQWVYVAQVSPDGPTQTKLVNVDELTTRDSLREWENHYGASDGGGVHERYTTIVLDSKDIKHGHYLRYHPDGSIHTDMWYWRGTVHGRVLWYWPSGQLQREQLIVQGIRHGETRQWYENGELAEEAPYRGGELHGEWRQWQWRKGGSRVPKFTTEYVRGKRSGKHIAWHDGGAESERGLYSDDARHGHWNVWHANGQKESEGTYHQDRKTGKWSYWDDTGKLLRTIDYGEPRKE